MASPTTIKKEEKHHLLTTSLPPTCRISIPDPSPGGGGDTVQSYLGHRWMDLGRPQTTLPYATIVPSSSDEIPSILKFASDQSLQVLPVNGRCGSVARVHPGTLYLDMANFRDISLDEEGERKTCTFGGGCLTGDVQPYVTRAGYYTGWPNLSCVGLCGNILGGGLNGFQGKRGYACDNLVRARIATPGGEIITVSIDDEDEEKRKLFNLLKGSGAGLAGVVLDLTVRIYPLEELNLPTLPQEESSPEEKKSKPYGIPGQTAFFSQENWSQVIDEVWDPLTRHISSSPASGAMIVMPAPPFLPPGTVDKEKSPAIILLSVEYPGSEAEAERFFSDVFTSKVRSLSLLPVPEKPKLNPVNTINAMRDATMGKGKVDGRPGDCFNALMRGMSADAVKRIATDYAARLASSSPGEVVGRCMTVLAPAPTKAQVAAEGEGVVTGMCHRDRGYMIQVAWTVGDEDGTDTSGLEWGSRALDLARGEDHKAGVSDAVLAGNARNGVPVEQILSPPERLEAWKAVKAKWDPRGIFWHPAVHGWE